jgi:hypothetical protein
MPTIIRHHHLFAGAPRAALYVGEQTGSHLQPQRDEFIRVGRAIVPEQIMDQRFAYALIVGAVVGGYDCKEE